MNGFEQYYEAVFKERYEEAVAEHNAFVAEHNAFVAKHNAYVKQTEENILMERYQNISLLMEKLGCSFDEAASLLGLSDEAIEKIKNNFLQI